MRLIRFRIEMGIIIKKCWYFWDKSKILSNEFCEFGLEKDVLCNRVLKLNKRFVEMIEEKYLFVFFEVFKWSLVLKEKKYWK